MVTRPLAANPFTALREEGGGRWEMVIHGCMMDDPYLLVNLRLDDRKSIEHSSKTYRTSIEHLSKIYRKSIEHLWIWGGSGVDLCVKSVPNTNIGNGGEVH